MVIVKLIYNIHYVTSHKSVNEHSVRNFALHVLRNFQYLYKQMFLKTTRMAID